MNRASRLATSISPAGSNAPTETLPADETAELVEIAAGGVDLGDHPACALSDGSARLGGYDPTAGALEELDAELGFELADLV